MSPLDWVVWALAIAVSVVVVGLAVGIAWGIIVAIGRGAAKGGKR